MRRERELLAALERVTTYDREGRPLTLVASDDAVLGLVC